MRERASFSERDQIRQARAQKSRRKFAARFPRENVLYGLYRGCIVRYSCTVEVKSEIRTVGTFPKVCTCCFVAEQCTEIEGQFGTVSRSFAEGERPYNSIDCWYFSFDCGTFISVFFRLL